MYYSSGSTIPPTYEKYLGQWIKDDGWFSASKCDPGNTINPLARGAGNEWSNPKTILPDTPSYDYTGKDIFISNPAFPLQCIRIVFPSSKDNFKYNAVWDRTPPVTSPYGTIT